MVNIEKAIEEFKIYTSNYDTNNEAINRKIYHTFRVVKLCSNIAKSLNLNDEQVKLAEFIGLFHDIGRFEQYKQYNTFSDLLSFDHGDYGVEVLDKNNYIDRFTSGENYNNIIRGAIKNHNKFKIEDGLSENELLFAKIIRDADKLDIIYETEENYFFKTQKIIDDIENGIITDSAYNQICNKNTILKSKGAGEIDKFLIKIALVYDMNFKYSYQLLKENEYINKCIDRFNYKNDETKKRMIKIREDLNKYIDDNI